MVVGSWTFEPTSRGEQFARGGKVFGRCRVVTVCRDKSRVVKECYHHFVDVGLEGKDGRGANRDDRAVRSRGGRAVGTSGHEGSYPGSSPQDSPGSRIGG